MTETLSALAARLALCAELMDTGRAAAAAALIRRLLAVMPPPTERHRRTARHWLDNRQ